MINLKVPAVFDQFFVDKLHEYNSTQDKVRISELYGNLPFKGIGSTRTPNKIPNINSSQLLEYTKNAKNYNLKFNYTMNTTCLGDSSLEELNKVLHDEMQMLLDLEIRNVTVSIPYIIEFIKEHYPDINVTASINLSLSSVSQIKHIRELGASNVVVDRSANRNIELLKIISKIMPIELLANSMCLPFCLLYPFHNNINSHYIKDDNLLEYPYIECYSQYIKNDIQMVCSGWIRPEDLIKYEGIGINHFKIEGRGADANVLLDIIQAYVNMSYDGSIFDLLFTGRRTRKLLGVYLENNSLGHFSDYFFNNPIDCRKCGGNDDFCKSIEKTIIVNDVAKGKFLIESDQKKKLFLHK